MSHTIRRRRTPAVAIAAGVLAAAAALTAVPAQAQSSVPRDRVEAAIADLEPLVEEAMASTGLPGMAITVVHDDEVIYLRGFGTRLAGEDLPVGPDTVFQMASLSKPMSSTVVAAAVGDRIASWSDPIASHIPGFTLSDPWVGEHVTVGDMFSHRSGLPDHAGDLLEDLGYDRDYILSRLRYEPLAPFRISYYYTNFGLTAGGEAVARAAGVPWWQLAEELLFDPAGMTQSSYRYADYEAAPDRAIIHAHVDGQFLPLFQRYPDAEAPAGGLSSTARDMGQWMRLQLALGSLDGEQIVASGPLQQTHWPQVRSAEPREPNGEAGFYGYGWIVGYPGGELSLSHSGAFNLGTGTTVTLKPADNLGIAILTNGAPVGMAEAVARSFTDLVDYGEVTNDWFEIFPEVFAEMRAEELAPSLPWRTPPADPTPPSAPSAYTGFYANDYFGPIAIVEALDRLWMVAGPVPFAFELTHFDGNSYTFETIGENANGPSGVVFDVGPDGVATSVTVTAWNRTGLGTFVR